MNTVHNSFLDYFDGTSPSKHPVFGRVTDADSMAVLQAIETTPTGPGDKPVEPVTVETITISD